jgi:hypothetical protein
MLAHGFTIPQMVELVHAGLAMATGERVVAGARKIEVARVRITETGRRALEGGSHDGREERAGVGIRTGAVSKSRQEHLAEGSAVYWNR